MEIKWKNIGTKILKTFIQAFLGAFTMDSFVISNDLDTMKSVIAATLIAGVSAGICAVWNLIIEMLSQEGESVITSPFFYVF